MTEPASTETTAALPIPAGRVADRLVRNLRPGQWIYPPEWAQAPPNRRWALVTGPPVTFGFGRDPLRIATVQCMWPDGWPLELREHPGAWGRVIMPEAPYLELVPHEITLLSGKFPHFPGLGMATFTGLPEQGPEMAGYYAEKAVDDGRARADQTDLRVEDVNRITGKRIYKLTPAEQSGSFTAELIGGDAP